MLLICWQNIYYYFYVGADFNFRDKSGSDLIVWSMLQEALQRGIKAINFGRMEKDNKSLAFFKKKWGAQERQLYYYCFPRAGFVTKREGLKYKFITGLFQRLPIRLAGLIGPPLTRHLG